MATIPPFPSEVRKVSDGEPVQASVSNKGPEDLTQRTDHLKARLDESSIGQILTLTDQVLDESVLVGTSVFRNPDTEKFEPGLAELKSLPDGPTGVIEVADSSYSWGIVTSKANATLGDIMLLGILPTDFDYTNTIEEDPDPITGKYEAGPYFLSSLEAGKVTRRPTISGLYQFFLSDDQSAYLLPSPHGILEDHIHRALALVAEPAGLANTVVDVDDIHEITIANSDLPGWLPADDPVFGTAAPVGAKFGYNVAKDPTLSSVFPPSPIEGTFLQKNGITVSFEDVIIDNSGIWWTRNDFGNVPWPVDIEVSGTSLSSTSGIQETDVELRLFMTEFVTKTDKTVVTKLTLAEGEQSIAILNPDGTVNDTGRGELKLSLNFNLTGGVDNLAGALVVKNVTDNQFERGLVVERIISGPSGLIQITSSEPDGQGDVTIDIPVLPNTPEDTLNLKVVANSPGTTVRQLSGSLWWEAGQRYVNIASAKVSSVFDAVSTTSNVRFDLLIVDVDDAVAVAPQWLEIVKGGEVAAGGADPFSDAPAFPEGKLTLAIIKVDGESGLGIVNIEEEDITNVKTLNRIDSKAVIGDLRQDGVDADNLSSDLGSISETGATPRYAPATHAHRVNTSGSTPVKDGAGAAGTAATYARSDHEHEGNVDSVDPEPLGTPASGTSLVYARRDHVHTGLASQHIEIAPQDTDELSILGAKVLSSDLSTILTVLAGSPQNVLFADATVNAINNAVYTDGGTIGDAGDAISVKGRDRWHGIYILEHPTMGTGAIASTVYNDFDNVRPAPFAVETIVKGTPPFPAGWSGSKFRRIGSAYIKTNDKIRLFSQSDHRVFPREAFESGLVGVGVKGNVIRDARFGCPPGASVMRITMGGTNDHLIRAFRSVYDPGVPPDSVPGGANTLVWGFREDDFITPPLTSLIPFSDILLSHPGGGSTVQSVTGYVTLDDPELREFIVRLEPAFSDVLSTFNYETYYDDPSLLFP